MLSSARPAGREIEEATLSPSDACVHVSEAPILTAAECRRTVAAAEAHAARAGGWGTRRHKAYPTTDLAVGQVPALSDWLHAALETRLLPQFASAFAFASGEGLYLQDLFVVKYSAREGGQAGLAAHEDSSAWSFVLPLNPPAEYERGGTQFMNLAGQPVFRPEAEGAAVMFSGMNRHRGVAVDKGIRYVLAGFLEMTTTTGEGAVDPRLAAAELTSWWHAKQREAETWMDPELAPLLPASQGRAGQRRPATDFGGGCDFGGGGGFSDVPVPRLSKASDPNDSPHATLLRLGHTAAAQTMLQQRVEHYRVRLQAADGDLSPAAQASRAALASCLLWLSDAAGAVVALERLPSCAGEEPA